MNNEMNELAHVYFMLSKCKSETEFRAGFKACYKHMMPILKEASIHVYCSAAAEHMLDGFKPQKRPIDYFVGRIKAVLEGSK